MAHTTLTNKKQIFYLLLHNPLQLEPTKLTIKNKIKRSKDSEDRLDINFLHTIKFH